jgi:hypothetical protein
MGAQISHTSSGEWQSFEARMRRRRAERCILRAEVAAEAGCLEDARAALDEARKLAPGLAEIAAVEANIFGREATLVAESKAHRTWRVFYYAAAVLACVAILSMGFVWWQRTTREAPSPAPGTVRQQAPGPSAAVPSPALPRPSRDVRVETVALTVATINEPPVVAKPVSAVLEARADTPEPPINVPDPMSRMVEREPARHEPVAEPVRREPVAEPLRREAVAEPPRREAAPAVDTPIAAAMRDVAPVRDLALASTSTASAAATPLPAPPPPRIDENAVRTVLHRYADAYSRLDASAAQEVWPRVNRAALSRAFDSLASQDISLGNCAVDVSGASARATCAGAATWAPKVGGGGARTEPRAWTFQLAKAGADWQIVNARVQNR